MAAEFREQLQLCPYHFTASKQDGHRLPKPQAVAILALTFKEACIQMQEMGYDEFTLTVDEQAWEPAALADCE